MEINTAVFTIIAKNYLAHARVLMASVARYHPDWARFVVLADRVDDHFDPSGEDFHVIQSHELGLPDSNWFHFKYTVLELSTGIKPYTFQYLYNRFAVDRIVFLDPDVRLYAPLTPVTGALASANIVLTPHLTETLSDAQHPTDLDILRSGAYNLGFIGTSRSDTTYRFLKWWAEKLYDHCVVDLQRGLFVDQRWIDLVPGMFDGVVVLRDPGLNVAYWNVAQRSIAPAEDGWLVNGEPLRFFHFSGFDPGEPERFSRHQNRYSLSDLSHSAQTIVSEYGTELFKNGYSQCGLWPYAFATFENGVRIPDVTRPVHHEFPPILDQVKDPFSDEGFDAFAAVWNVPAADSIAEPVISRLAYRIYRMRPDVQAAMPDVFGADRIRFINWLLSSGRSEHVLDDAFLVPVRESLRGAAAAGHSGAQQLFIADDWRRKLQLHRVSESVWWMFNAEPAGGLAALHEMIAGEPAGLRLTRLARAIYESRPDLQIAFPDPCGSDAVPFLVWILTYGRREHRLTRECLSPLQQQWETQLALVPSSPRALWYRSLLQAMAASIQMREALASLSTGGKQSRPGLEHDGSNAPAGSDEILDANTCGVNLVGYFTSETGMGQSVRAAHHAALAAGLDARLSHAPDASPSRKGDRESGPMSDKFPYPVSIFHVNADQTEFVHSRVDPSLLNRRCRIGYWVWETENFPNRWRAAFQSYHEIWTPSSFCRSAIARHSPIPVSCIPHAIAPLEPATASRERFGLPAEGFVFLTMFDVLSVVNRKNPLATVRAFASAFRENEAATLVVKINNARKGDPLLAELRAAAPPGRIQIIDAVLDRTELNALILSADCVVSLHRSEGFGLALAEAMYFGKPVIATGYSGNLDFMHEDNSFLVNHRMVPVGLGSAPYPAGSVWADPDVEHAAELMRRVVRNPDLAAQVAGRGQSYVRTHLSPERVGGQLRQRVEALTRVAAEFEQPSAILGRPARAY